MEQIEKLGREILDKMELVSETENPSESIQLLAKKWKDDACATLRKAAKIEIPKLKQKIDNLNIKYDLVLTDDTLSEDEKSESEAILLQQIIKLESQLFLRKRKDIAVKNYLEGETIGKY